MSETFNDWAILELMGHRQLAGRVTEVEIAGASFLRIDVPEADGEPEVTEYYGAAAVYCLTPTTEETAREAAVRSRPRAPSLLRLSAPGAGGDPDRCDDDDEDLSCPA